jgi:AraC-like DNA-binding protein
VGQGASEVDVALRVSVALTSRRHGLMELAARASSTVGDALGHLARWVPLLHDGLDAALERAEGESSWILRTPRRPRGVGQYVHELALAHAVGIARQGAASIGVSRVWFLHPRPADVGSLVAFFGTRDVEFGREDSGFSLSLGQLDCAMSTADVRTFETIAPLVDAELDSQPRGHSFSERVRAHIASVLPAGTDVSEVAASMHMSSRTLQRRLEGESTRFTEVLDRARLGEARRLLADPSASLTDVAFRLGFADLATFSRAFKRWTGKPPGQWRRS